MEAMASAGVTTPATQDVAWITTHERPWGRTRRDAPVERGNLVAFAAGVIAGGYVGELGRTRPVAGGARRRPQPVAPLGGVVGPAPRRLPGRIAVDRSARGLRRHRGRAASHAGGAGTRARVRPSPRHAPAPTDGRRAAPRGGHGAGAHGLCRRQGHGALYGQEPVVVTANGPELLSTTPFHETRSP